MIAQLQSLLYVLVTNAMQLRLPKNKEVGKFESSQKFAW